MYSTMSFPLKPGILGQWVPETNSGFHRRRSDILAQVGLGRRLRLPHSTDCLITGQSVTRRSFTVTAKTGDPGCGRSLENTTVKFCWRRRCHRWWHRIYSWQHSKTAHLRTAPLKRQPNSIGKKHPILSLQPPTPNLCWLFGWSLWPPLKRVTKVQSVGWRPATTTTLVQLLRTFGDVCGSSIVVVVVIAGLYIQQQTATARPSASASSSTANLISRRSSKRPTSFRIIVAAELSDRSDWVTTTTATKQDTSQDSSASPQAPRWTRLDARLRRCPYQTLALVWCRRRPSFFWLLCRQISGGFERMLSQYGRNFTFFYVLVLFFFCFSYS